MYVVSYEHVALFCFVRYYLLTLVVVIVVVSAVPAPSTCSATDVSLSPVTLQYRKALVVNWCGTDN